VSRTARLLQVAAQLDDLVVAECVQIDGLTVVMVVDLAQELAHFGDLALVRSMSSIFCQTLGSQPK